MILKKRNIRLSSQPISFPGNQGVDGSAFNSEGKEILDNLREIASRLDSDEKAFTYQPKVGCGGQPAAVVEVRLQTLVFRLIWYLDHLSGFTQELAYRALSARVPALVDKLGIFPSVDSVPLAQLESYTVEYFERCSKLNVPVSDEVRDKIPVKSRESKIDDSEPIGPVLVKLADRIGSVGDIADNLQKFLALQSKDRNRPHEALIQYGSERLMLNNTKAALVILGPLCAQSISQAEILFAMAKFSETLGVLRAAVPYGRQITSGDLANLYDVEHRMSRTLKENSVWLSQIAELVDVTTVRPLLDDLLSKPSTKRVHSTIPRPLLRDSKDVDEL